MPAVPYNEDPLYAALLRLPKVDLHTHLNGSISNACLAHLAGLLFGEDSSTARVFAHTDEEGPSAASPSSPSSSSAAATDRTTALFTSAATEVGSDAHTNNNSAIPVDPAARMHYCFAVFDAIYKVMNSLDASRVACQDVVFHYLAEGASYVEIRTSIRAGMHATFAGHKAFVDAVAAANGGNAKAGESTQWDYWSAVTNAIADSLTLTDVCGAPSSAGPREHRCQLPSYVSLEAPLFGTIHPSFATLVASDAYVSGLKRWAELFGGASSFVGAYVLGLAAEATRVAEALRNNGDNASASPSIVRNLSTSDFPCVEAVRRLKVRMLLSISRGQSISDGEGTAAIIPAILAADAEALRLAASKEEEEAAVVAGEKGADAALTTARKHKAAAAAFACVFPLLVGIDLGGSAYKGHLPDILDLLGRVRSAHGLPMTLHGGEKSDDAETAQMMAFAPERWGHLVFISDAHREALQQQQPPMPRAAVELCITSNMITNGSCEVTEHHVDTWLDCLPVTDADAAGAPSSPTHVLVPRGTSHVSLHTDDRGVFASSLTRELWLFSQHERLFPAATFGLVGSAERASALLPIIRPFHREAIAVAFAPPHVTALGAEAVATYRSAALAAFDAAAAVPQLA